MAKRNVFDCDRCMVRNLSENEILNLALKIDRQMDAAGSMDDIVEYVDLCSNCVRNLYLSVIRQYTNEQRKNLLQNIIEFKNKAKEMSMKNG